MTNETPNPGYREVDPNDPANDILSVSRGREDVPMAVEVDGEQVFLRQDSGNPLVEQPTPEDRSDTTTPETTLPTTRPPESPPTTTQ